MTKRTYKTQKFQTFKQYEALENKAVVVGIDVAKKKFFAAIALKEDARHPIATVTFNQPEDLRIFVDWLATLPSSSIEVALESSGTYGDSLRHLLYEASKTSNISQFLVDPKRVHDGREAFDGTPSMHDAKAAHLIGYLHSQGFSSPWRAKDEQYRKMRALLTVFDFHKQAYIEFCGRLEAQLARHWPELALSLSLGSAGMNALLLAYPSPALVRKSPKEANDVVKKASHSSVKSEKISSMLNDAQTSVGVPSLDEEDTLTKTIVQFVEMARLKKNAMRNEIEKMIDEMAKKDLGIGHIRAKIGRVSTAVLLAYVGHPRNFSSSGAYLKMLGLNLREYSSGTKQSGLHITKRGQGKPRNYLYLATLRCLMKDDVFKAYFEKHAPITMSGKRKGSISTITAMMRKLTRGLWHCANYNVAFNSEQLFDTRRLKIERNLSLDDVEEFEKSEIELIALDS